MRDLSADIQETRKRVDALRKSARLPYWRMAFADFMLDRTSDYLVIGREQDAVEMLSRLDRWIEKNQAKASPRVHPEAPEIRVWGAPQLSQDVSDVRVTLSDKKALIPVAERDSYARRLDKIEKWIEEGKLRKAHGEILSVRSGLISRLHRSYRARVAVIPHRLGQNFANPNATHSAVGLYNSQRTLDGSFALIGERDPIWVEDFLEIYDNLLKITDRLAPVEKKKGR